MSDTYQCELCEQTFEKGRSDAEAEADRQKEFPGIPTEGCALVCDDCYKLVMGWTKVAKMIYE